MIHFKVQNQILEVQWEDPKSKNALSIERCKELLHHITESKPRGLLLSSKGRVFCSGGHLKDYSKLATKSEGVQINSQIAELLNQLDLLPIPKVAIVNGHCLGGGIELLSCFDRVLATPDALFGLWQRKNGLSFGWGGRARLEGMLSRRALRAWYISASVKSAYQVQEMGLVDKVGSRSSLFEEALRWLEKSQKLPLKTLDRYKDPQVSEQQAFSDLWWSEDHKKSLTPYRSKD